MAAIVREAHRARARSASRRRARSLHRAIDGEPVPGTFAGEDELFGIGRALGAGRARRLRDGERPRARGQRVRVDGEARARRPAGPSPSRACRTTSTRSSGSACCDSPRAANARGAHLVPQVAAGPTGLLLGLESSFHPFSHHPSYRGDRRAAARRARAPHARPGVPRAHPRGGADARDLPIAAYIARELPQALPARRPAGLRAGAREERRGRSPRARAARRRRSPTTCCSSATARSCSTSRCSATRDGNFDAIREMLMHPQAVLGLCDGGAHCGIICDASMPTFLLTHWVRDRTRGARLPLEQVVRLQTRNTAALFGLADRGALAPGLRADVNVIDLENLRLAPPEIVFDLPAGGRRLMQRARGYRMTIQSRPGRPSRTASRPARCRAGSSAVRRPRPAPSRLRDPRLDRRGFAKLALGSIAALAAGSASGLRLGPRLHRCGPRGARATAQRRDRAQWQGCARRVPLPGLPRSRRAALLRAGAGRAPAARHRDPAGLRLPHPPRDRAAAGARDRSRRAHAAHALLPRLRRAPMRRCDFDLDVYQNANFSDAAHAELERQMRDQVLPWGGSAARTHTLANLLAELDAMGFAQAAVLGMAIGLPFGDRLTEHLDGRDRAIAGA